jgi:hypothetical protein
LGAIHGPGQSTNSFVSLSDVTTFLFYYDEDVNVHLSFLEVFMKSS